MNTIDTVFEWLIAATLRASVLVAAVLLIQMILRPWLSAGWRHALWLPMLAVLVLPVLPEASFGLFPKAAVQPTKASEVWVSSGSSTETSISAMPAPGVEAEMKTAPPINVAAPVNYFAIAWLVGACGVLSAGIIGYRQNMLRIRTNAITPDRMLQVSIDEAAREVGLKRAPQTLISSSVASPAVTGFSRPILLLPAGFPEGFSASEVRLILLHEFTHLKRFDLQLNWLVCLLQAAHWFNPLLWFAFARMRADREAACDASVLSIDAKDYRAEYGSALLKLECVAPSRMLSLGFVGIFERGSEIKSRIKEISAHRPNRFLWQAVGGSIVTLLMIFGITKGQEAKPQEVAVAPDEINVDEATVKIQNKLNSIIIPSIDFEDTSLQEAIDYLRVRSAELDEKELDAAKKGFNFVILNPNEGAAVIKIDELRLRNVPLSTVIKLICDKIHYRYTVENFSVVLTPNDQPAKPKEGALPPPAAKVDEETVKIQNKLNSIIIPRIDFEDTTLQEAIDFLRLRAVELDEKELDPKKKGFNFVILNPREGAADIKIDDLKLRNVPLSVVLKYLCDSYKVENFSVVLTPNDQPAIPRERKLPPPEAKVDEETVKIQNKLSSIIIPHIDFEDTTLQEAIDYLRLRAVELDEKELDPVKKGFNFVILKPREGAADIKIDDLNLRRRSLSTVLTYICLKTNYQYKVENQVVVLSPKD